MCHRFAGEREVTIPSSYGLRATPVPTKHWKRDANASTDRPLRETRSPVVGKQEYGVVARQDQSETGEARARSAPNGSVSPNGNKVGHDPPLEPEFRGTSYTTGTVAY